MGNRAMVVFTNKDNSRFSPAVYLHWNGGPESVYPFLNELDRREVRADQEYEAARFVAIVSEFFDQNCYSGLSLGVRNGPTSIHELGMLNQGDNGVYLVCRGEGKSKVRRFMMHYSPKANGQSHQEWKEFSQEKVEEERREAEAHKYNNPIDGIPSVFTKKNEREHYEEEKKKRQKASLSTV